METALAKSIDRLSRQLVIDRLKADPIGSNQKEFPVGLDKLVKAKQLFIDRYKLLFNKSGKIGYVIYDKDGNECAEIEPYKLYENNWKVNHRYRERDTITFEKDMKAVVASLYDIHGGRTGYVYKINF